MEMSSLGAQNIGRKSLRVVWFLFALSMPVSYFGMQAFLALGVLLLLWIGWQSRFQAWPRTPLDPALLVLALAIGLSLLLSPNGWSSFPSNAAFLIALSFWVAYAGLQSERQLRLAIYGIWAIVALSALLGIYQSYTGHYPLGTWLHPRAANLLKPAPGVPGRFSAVGFFYSRLRFAHVLMFSFCVVFGVAMERMGWRMRSLLLGLLALLGFAILCTWVRTIPFAIGCALLAWIWWKIQRKLLRTLAALSLSGLLGMALLFTPGFLTRVAHSFEGSRDWGRAVLWQTALDFTSEHPLTGIGFGNFSRDVRPVLERKVKEMGLDRFAGVIAFAHNDLLNIQAECGLLGAFAYCFLFVAYFRTMLRALNRRDPAQPWLNGFLQGSLIGVVAYLLSSVFHDHFFFMEVAYNLWFVLGTSLSALQFQRIPPGTAPQGV